MKLCQLESFPDQLLEISATAVHEIFPSPTLLHLRGRVQQPLFVSVLLHGNEHSGFEAVQQLLRKYQNHPLPRDLSIFIGNTAAARDNQRVLDGQPDYNRVWPGTELDKNLPEVKLMQQVVDVMRARDLYASIDVHNNTGLNPHYGCVNVLEPAHLQLAAEFSRTVIYFNTPHGVQSKAMSAYCPATTIECGKSGGLTSAQHAFDFIDSILHKEGLCGSEFKADSIDLFHTVARIVIHSNVDFGFSKTSSLQLDTSLDHLNFSETVSGTKLGEVSDTMTVFPLIAYDEQGRDVTSRYLTRTNNQIVTTQSIMPAMLTLDEDIIRQDCLCYFMERIHLRDDRSMQYERE